MFQTAAACQNDRKGKQLCKRVLKHFLSRNRLGKPINEEFVFGIYS